MTRGEIWVAHVGGKKRPVLILTRPEVIDVRQFVTVAEVTASVRGLAVEVEIDHASAGLNRPLLSTAMVSTPLRSRACRNGSVLLTTRRWVTCAGRSVTPSGADTVKAHRLHLLSMLRPVIDQDTDQRNSDIVSSGPGHGK